MNLFSSFRKLFGLETIQSLQRKAEQLDQIEAATLLIPPPAPPSVWRSAVINASPPESPSWYDLYDNLSCRGMMFFFPNARIAQDVFKIRVDVLGPSNGSASQTWITRERYTLRLIQLKPNGDPMDGVWIEVNGNVVVASRVFWLSFDATPEDWKIRISIAQIGGVQTDIWTKIS